MTREWRGRAVFYLLAITISGFVALGLTTLADDYLPTSPDDSYRLGLLGFLVIVIFDLFMMYDVWSTRQAEGRAATKMLTGLAVGGLALASVMGLLLQFFGRLSFEAFVWSFLVVRSIEAFTIWWIDRRDPDPTIPKRSHWRFLLFLDVLIFFFGSYRLIGIWQESPMAVPLGIAFSIIPSIFVVYGHSLQRKSHQSEQTPGSLPPAVTK